MEDEEIEKKKEYATAYDMYKALVGCGCCVDDYDIGYEDLKFRIIIEELIDRGHL